MATNEKGIPICCVCLNPDRIVAHEHVICRVCNERIWHKSLTPEELERLEAEYQYRRDNP